MPKLDQLIKDLRPLLREYLEKQGIEISATGSLRCLNPEHNDANPSMQINTKKGGDVAYCYNCGAYYDIFAAASELEGAASSGSDWLKDNVFRLARALDLKIPEMHFQDLGKSSQTLQALRLYRTAADIVASGNLSEEAQAYVKDEAGWSDEAVETFKLGCISKADLIGKLELAGFNLRLINASGLGDERVFDGISLVFPHFSWKRSIIGFSARRFSGKRKYINISSPDVSDFPSRGASLFIPPGQPASHSETAPTFLVEGQSDVISLWNKGISAIGLSGSSLSREACKRLNKLDFATGALILAPDGDSAGRKALTKNLIPTALRFSLTPIPKVYLLPDNRDPRDLITEEGEEALLDKDSHLDIVTAYCSLRPDESPDLVATRLSDLASHYSSPISRDVLADHISERLGLSKASVIASIEDAARQRSLGTDKKLQHTVNDLAHQLQTRPAAASQILLNGLDRVTQLESQSDVLGSEQFAAQVKTIREAEEESSDTFPGYTLRDMPGLQEYFAGDWRQKLIIIGGDENVGKSTLVDILIYQIISDPDNNAMAILFLTDDSVESRTCKYVCQADREVGKDTLTYQHVNYPNYYATTTFLKDARRKAYKRFLELIADDRIVIKDVKSGTDVSFFTSLIRYYRGKYPDRNIIAGLDSINCLDSPRAFVGDARQSMNAITLALIRAINRYRATAIAVAEFRRRQGHEFRKDSKIVWPTNKRLAESRALEFHADATILTYQDMHTRGQDAELFWIDDEGFRRPRNVLIIDKNKINRRKGKLIYDFDETRARLTEVDISRVRSDWQKAIEAGKNRSSATIASRDEVLPSNVSSIVIEGE